MELPELLISQWTLTDAPGQVLVTWLDCINNSLTWTRHSADHHDYHLQHHDDDERGVTANVRKEHKEDWKPRGDTPVELFVLEKIKASLVLSSSHFTGGGWWEEKNCKTLEKQRKASPWENPHGLRTRERLKGRPCKDGDRIRALSFCLFPGPSDRK